MYLFLFCPSQVWRIVHPLSSLRIEDCCHKISSTNFNCFNLFFFFLSFFFIKECFVDIPVKSLSIVLSFYCIIVHKLNIILQERFCCLWIEQKFYFPCFIEIFLFSFFFLSPYENALDYIWIYCLGKLLITLGSYLHIFLDMASAVTSYNSHMVCTCRFYSMFESDSIQQLGMLRQSPSCGDVDSTTNFLFS